MTAAAARYAAAWRRGYAIEVQKYRRAHLSHGNLVLHALLSPIEWIAFLLMLRNGTAVWAVQIAALAGTVLARRIALALPQALFAPIANRCAAFASRPAAAAVWLGAIALQVGVGHGLLDRTVPSAASSPITVQTVLLNVPITWDALGIS